MTGEIGWDPPDLKILSNLDNLERLWKSKIIIWEDLGYYRVTVELFFLDCVRSYVHDFP